MTMRPILRLITGGAGTGKTSRCIEFFRERIWSSGLAGLTTPAYFILPNREHADRIHALLLRDDRFKGIAGHHVMPVSDFIRYRAWGGRRVLTQSERAHLASLILAEEKWEWMDGSAGTRGMPPLLAAYLREIKSARVDRAQFAKAAAGRGGEDAARFRDLLRFWDAYEARKAAMGARDAEDAIEDFAARSKDKDAEEDTDLVVFDGFFSLTELQTAFVEALTRRCRHILFTLTAEPDRRPGLFAYPLRLRERLLSMGFAEEHLAGMRRTSRPGILHLERAWGQMPPAVSSDPADGVEFVTAATRRQELEWIAREALREVREGRRHFSDHMVVVRNLEGYRPWIEEVFGSLGVPFDIHERRRVEDHPWARALLQLVSVSAENQGARARRSQAWAAWIETAALASDRASAIALGSRLRGCPVLLPLLQLDSDPAFKGMGGREGEIWAEEKELVGLLETADAAGWQAAMLGALGRLAAGSQPDKESERIRETLDSMIRRCAVSEAQLPGSERLARLAAMIREGLYSVREPSKNRIQFYDVILALPKEYRVVYVCGLSMGEFPRDHRQHPLLNDGDRRALAGAGLKLETSAQRFENERYLFYMACARASERLVLLRHSLDEDGRERTASPWLAEVKALFSSGLQETRREPDELLPDPRAAELRAPREVLESLAAAAAHGAAWKSDGDVLQELTRLWDAWPENVRAAAGFAGRAADVLAWAALAVRPARLERPQAVEAWNDPSGTAISASGITALRLCPFRFFAQNALEVREPLVSTAMERGKFLHALMQELLEGREGVPGSAVRLAALPEAEAVRRARELFDARSAETVIAGEARHERVWWIHLWRELFAEAVRREREMLLSRPSLVPQMFEMPFKDVPHTAGGERFRLKGFIDRVDVSVSKTGPPHALAVDYKSGGLAAASALERGRMAQAVVYPTALQAIGRWKPVGLEYVSLARNDRRRLVAPGLCGESVFETDTEWQEALGQEWVRIAEAMRVLRSGNVEPTPSQDACRDCAYGPVCRKRAEGIFSA